MKLLKSTVIFAFISIVQSTGSVYAASNLPAPEIGFEPMSFVNYESPHVRPIAITPNQQKLLAVNTADNRLMVFDLASGSPTLTKSIPVGVEPVSVNARTNNEAWVVNHLSDSITIVDINTGKVLNTISTGDEPADVVFAGTPQRAFVTASQVNRVNVFSTTNPQLPPEEITIFGEDPRMLATSPDGQTVYAAIFESGNGTTIMAGGKSLPRIDDVVANSLSPYNGNTIIPNAGSTFNPPMNPNNPPPPPVSIIVKKQESGQWLDDNNGDWSRFVGGDLAALADRVPGWDLPDRDIAIIDANSLSVNYQTRLMNMVMAIAVNPRSGKVSAVGTDATNEVRFEPVLNGKFVRAKLATFSGPSDKQVVDLNPHLDYSRTRVSQSSRNLSIGDPRSIAWRENGQQALVAGMGSNNVIVVNENGAVITRIEVGEGPTGIVISEATKKAFVLNRFGASISIIDLNTNQVISNKPYFDPTPEVIVAGRPFLYDTHESSGLGQASCASCHVDSRTDRLAWDLGDPAAGMSTRVDNVGKTWTFHPMKGPMKTQTLQDIIGSPSLHHRGDKDDIFGFANTYRDLQGDDNPLNNSNMAKLEAYLDTIHFPPNPNRNIDNSLSTTVTIQGPNSSIQRVGNAVAGFEQFQQPGFACLSCHLGERGRSDTKGANGLHDGQQAIAEPIGGFYDRMGFFWGDAQGSTSGFGFRTDGSQDSTFREENTTTDILAAFLSWDGPKPNIGGLSRDSHAGIGQQVQLKASTNARAKTLMSISSTGNIGLVAHGFYDGKLKSYEYLGNEGFQSDAMGEIVSYSDLLRDANNGGSIVLSLVARGSEYRLALDSDLDGKLNRDDSAPFEKANSNWTDCAIENAVCSFSGFAVVRYGTLENWLYTVSNRPVNCSNSQFGDPAKGRAKKCQYLPSDSNVAANPPTNAVRCAGENAACVIPSGKLATVYYGAGDNWNYKTDLSGEINCSNPVFGDPAFLTAKSCFYLTTGDLVELSNPVANPDTVSVTSSNQVTINPLSNDTGSNLVLQAPSTWSLKGGQVALANNQLRYTPKPGFNGEDKIWYTIKDSQGRSNWSVIVINVSGNGALVNVPPVANPDTVSVTSPNQVTISPLANDTGSNLVLQAPNAWSWKGGQVALVNNQLRYTPKPNFNGEDKIWYSVKDSQGRGGWSVIIINVSGNNSNISAPPTASPDNVTTTSGTVIIIDVLANDTGSGLVLNAPNAWSLAGGSVSLVDNKLTYKSKAGFTGSDNIWYTFSDSQGRSNSGQVNITVNAASTSSTPFPIATADSYTVPKNSTRTLNILNNDTPSTGLVIDTLYEYSSKGGRTSRANNNREVLYTPKVDFTGTDDFWYVLIDSQGRKNSAKVTINVTP